MQDGSRGFPPHTRGSLTLERRHESLSNSRQRRGRGSSQLYSDQPDSGRQDRPDSRAQARYAHALYGLREVRALATGAKAARMALLVEGRNGLVGVGVCTVPSNSTHFLMTCKDGER